tara:strand:+ start:12499 stop:12720 length:222 start_codon:yes stop_codon:yes gene_type:complete
MWPFSTRQERQAAEMAQILAENSYERKMERMAGWVRTFVALAIGIGGTFAILIILDELGTSPVGLWEYLKDQI